MIVEWYLVHILCEYASVESCGPWSLFPLRNAHVAFLPEFISAAVVQLTSGVRLFATPRTAACQASLSFTISWSLLKFMPMELVMPSSHLILCHPLLLLPLVFPSIRVSAELALCIRWPKCQSFSFSISPSNEHPGLISFRIDQLISLQSKGLSRVTKFIRQIFSHFFPSVVSFSEKLSHT